MPLLVILNFIIAFGCCYHALRSGRDRYWIFIILGFPAFGSLLYLAVEYFPSRVNRRQVAHAKDKLREVVDPDYRLREAADRLEVSENFHNHLTLADTLLEKGHTNEAIQRYAALLDGPYEQDASLLSRLVLATHQAGDLAETCSWYERLQSHHPDLRDQELTLLYAEALGKQGRLEDAIPILQAEIDRSTALAPRIRLAQLYDSQGQRQEAAALCRECLGLVKHAPKHVVRAEKSWIEMAERYLAHHPQ